MYIVYPSIDHILHIGRVSLEVLSLCIVCFMIML